MNEIIPLTRQLMGYQSVHARPQEILDCAAHIESYLKAHRIAYRRFDYANTPSLLVTRPDGYVPVLLMSHIDVVDGPAALFQPVEKDGKLFGRGAVDDKYAVALSLVLVKKLLQSHPADSLPMGLLITGDEEVGGHNGARRVLGQLKTDFGIALDGGDPDTIVVEEKGLLKLKLISHGRSAHGSRPWLGENAIEKLIADYYRIKGFFTDLKSAQTDHWHRTLNFSRIAAGRSHNQVPDRAEASFDIRYTKQDDMEYLLGQMRRRVQGQLVVESMAPVFEGGQSPYLDLLLQIAPSARCGQEHGASDARHLSIYDTPGIVWGADGDMSQHAEDEHVNIHSVQRLYDLLVTYAERIHQGDVLQPAVPS